MVIVAGEAVFSGHAFCVAAGAGPLVDRSKITDRALCFIGAVVFERGQIIVGGGGKIQSMAGEAVFLVEQAEMR